MSSETAQAKPVAKDDIFKRFARSSLARLLLLGFLMLLLQIPIGMIGGLTVEREHTRGEARAEIAQTWGGRQDVMGPVLVQPVAAQKTDASGWRVTGDTAHAVLLAERLRMDGEVRIETRRRGLFELPVYTARLTLRGRIAPAAAEALGLQPSAIPVGKPLLVLRLSDVHAVDSPPRLLWNGNELGLEAGTKGFDGAPGLHAVLPEAALKDGGEFTVTLALRGSGGLYFAPLGRTTEVELKSGWPHPSFLGAWLPRERNVDAQGFGARWSIPDVARGFPATWTEGAVSEETLQAARFGVDFLFPVDPYRMSERSLKYAALFIALSFLALWLFEVKAGVRSHPVQYLLLGAALCMFYLLELSLAEHFGFAAAYALASGAVTAQIGFFSRSVLGTWRRAATMIGLVSGLYGLLYLLLREEDYALLVGSSGLFAALSVVMFLTRRVRWETPPAVAARDTGP